MKHHSISLTVIRHGQSEANECRVISDRETDHQLTDTGTQQARDTAELLKNQEFDLIVSSSRQRARKTAEIINAHHGLKILVTDDLIERDFGIIGGVGYDEAQDMMKKTGFNWADIPESETPAEIDDRVKRLLSYLNKSHTNSKILVSTHEDVVKSFHRILNGVSVEKSMNITVNNSEPHYF